MPPGADAAAVTLTTPAVITSGCDLDPDVGGGGAPGCAKGPTARFGESVARPPLIARTPIATAQMQGGPPLRSMRPPAGVDAGQVQCAGAGDAPDDLDVFVHPQRVVR